MPLQGDFTQWITADFNNDSYDKWLSICFLMSENMHWQKKCHQNNFSKEISIKNKNSASHQNKGNLNVINAKVAYLNS